MYKALALTTIFTLSLTHTSFSQTTTDISADTLKASKLALKSKKLIESGKQKKVEKGLSLMEEAGSMGLPSACRYLSDYYMLQTPPDADKSVHWLEILGDMGDSLSINKLVDIYSGSLSDEGYPSDANMTKLSEWSKALATSGNMKGMEHCAACFLATGDTTQAIGWLEKAANAGSVVSQRSLSKIYSQPGSNNVPSRAFEYAEKASNQGDVESTYMLANMYSIGYGCVQNYDKALECLEKCKGSDIEDLDVQIAFCTIQKNGGHVDSSTFPLLLAAAEKGNSTAQKVIGDCYANGEGVDLDMKKAIEWYEKAGAQDNPIAQYSCAMLYLTENGPLPQDTAKGMEWLEKAASAGLAPAQSDLGLCYLEGKYVGQDFSKAIDLLERSSNQGYPISQSTLGGIYIQGEGVEKDEVKGMRLIQNAAAQGFTEAQYNVGVCYLSKIAISGLTDSDRLCTEELVALNTAYDGKLSDADIGAYWLRKAAKGGHPMAQHNLALMILGKAATGTEQEAVELLEKSCSEGIAEAQYTLGSLYLGGQAGVKKNVNKGLDLIKKSADQGFAQAQNDLGLIYLQGIPGVQTNAKTGFSYLQKSATQGYPASMYFMAICYAQGAGVKTNITEAKTWLQKAANQEMDPQVSTAAKEALKQLK